MTMSRYMKDQELIEKGTKALFKELGYSDAIRFLAVPRESREETVQRHRQWQHGLNKDAFFQALFGSETETPDGGGLKAPER